MGRFAISKPPKIGEIKQRSPMITVIFLTGNIEDQGVSEAIKNGAYDVVGHESRMEPSKNRGFYASQF